jgi:hypothetical protein
LNETYAAEPLLRGFTGALLRIADFYHRTLLERDGCIAAGALAQFRATMGHWPQSLDEAFVGRPAGLSVGPHFGTEFVYSLENGKPRLYHAGEDGEDNGGRVAADPTAIDAPPGTDVVLIP